MTDIVERPCPRCNDTGNSRYWEGRWRDTHAENQKLLDKIERLRASVDLLRKDNASLRDVIDPQAEIEYLRSALERIRFTEGISRSVEKIALDALRRSRNGSREQKNDRHRGAGA
jgi:hypothetical protein